MTALPTSDDGDDLAIPQRPTPEASRRYQANRDHAEAIADERARRRADLEYDIWEGVKALPWALLWAGVLFGLLYLLFGTTGPNS